MKRVSGNVSIEKVTQPKPNAVTITRASSSSSHDDNNEDDDYYDEDEEEEFEPSPAVVRTPNLSQVQITPRNVSRPTLNITPVISPSAGNRSLPQASSNTESKTQKIPDRPFKIFSKENKGDDDIIIESTSIKSTPLPNFVKPNPPVRSSAPPIRAPRLNRPALVGPHTPRARAPSLSPMRMHGPRAPQPLRGPVPQVRGRLPNPTPLQGPRPINNRGRPRTTFSPYQRAQTPPGPRMQFSPRMSQSPQRLPRTPIGFNSTRGAPRMPMARQTRLRPPIIPPNAMSAPMTRKLSSQIQITPRNTVAKPFQNPQVSSQPAVNIKPEPQDYEEDYESDNYEDELPSNMPPPRTVPPQQKLPQVNIAPTGVQTPRSALPAMPRISSAVQITPKVSSQVQITPRSLPHVTQAKVPAVMNRQVEDDQVNVKEEPMETEPTAESYDEYREDQEEEYYNEEEEEAEAEEYDEYDSQQQSVPSGSRPVEKSISTGRKSSVVSSNEVLPATPVSLANIKQGPIIKEEPKDEDQDAEMTDDYYNEDNYEENSYESAKASQLNEAKVAGQSSNAPPRVSNSVQITPKVGSQVQLTPQKKAGQPNMLPVVSSSLQITPAKQPSMGESEEQFDENYEEEAEEEEEEYYDEEMEDEHMSDYPPSPQVSKTVQLPPSAPPTQITPNKFQNVSITPNSSTPVLPKMSGVSITPNKPLTSLISPAKPQSVSLTPNVPKGISITPNKLQNISISPSKTQASLAPPNLPKGISITPKKQQFVSTTSSAVSITPNKPPGISMAPRGNTQVSNIQSNNIQIGSGEYYEDEEELGEEEESFEDYDEDDLHEDALYPKSSTNPTSITTSSNNLLQKPTQPKVEPRAQHVAKPGPAPANTSAPPSPQETKMQTRSTPTKPSTSDVKKPVAQSRSPAMSSYQSPISQAPAPHGRPRSLIEAISMISSGKMCVSNLSAPSTNKKTPKKEENVEKNTDNKPESPGKVSEKVPVQDTNSYGSGNAVSSDNNSKTMAETIENNPTTPVKEETVQSVVDVPETLEANEVNDKSAEISKTENKNTEERSKSPRTKMRPKSKLLQFRKQMKNPVVQENTPESGEAKTNATSSPPVQFTSVISEVNINVDRTSDTQNEVSSLDGKNLESLQSDSNEPGTVDKTDHSDEEKSGQEQSTSQSEVVENSEQTNDTTNSQNPNIEVNDDEMLVQDPTDQEDNNKNDVDYYNDNGTSLEQEANSDIVRNDIEEANEIVDNKQTYIEQEDSTAMMEQSNENIAESIPPSETHETGETEGEEKMDTEGDTELKKELDEDMAQKIMREQNDEYPTDDFNNTEEEPGQEESELQEEEEEVQNEENEEDEEEEEEGDEQSDEEETGDKEEEETGAEGSEEKEGETKMIKKAKKKGSKRKKAKKRSAKRKSTDSKLDETPAAKKSKTDEDEAMESGGDKEEGGDKSGSNKAINLRKNIRDVIDENQLDPATLAAQKEEAERLKRVQEQQQRLKEVQRQIAQNNKAAKMMNLLEGENSGSSKPSPMVFNLSSGSLNKKMLELLKSQKKEEEGEAGEGETGEGAGPKLPNLGASSLAHPLNITSSVSLVPVKKPEPALKGKDSSAAGTEVTLSDSDEDCILISEPSDDEGSGEEDRDDPSNSGMHTNDEFNVPDEQGRVLVNLAHEPSEPDIFLAPQIARIIKPHQIGGIRFLFDNIIETTERYKNSPGFGCILAHSMGLGKTLQIVSFSDIFLRHTEGRTVVCIMPINTLQNWVSEFNMWLPLPGDLERSPLLASGEVRPREFPIFILNDFQKNLPARAKVIKEWYTQGGVLMIGYELYRQLSLKKPKKTRRGRGKEPAPPEEEPDDRKQQLLEEIYEALVSPGPDLVICDEGHRIKNSHASTSHALKQIKTRRRVVLTGYPLQNNLLEYWCMVDFVRPNYLGTKTEFSNMFERPIQNGQCVDSTPQDVRLMRHRAHVLHSLLQGFVQRRSHMVLQKTLPVKEEYVLLVRMTPLQRQLYETFMNEVVRTKAVPNPLKAFAVCCKIWNHPDVLYNFLKKRQAGSEDVVADLDIEENAAIVPGCEPGTPSKRGSRSKAAAGGRNAAGAGKNARKGGSPKGPDGTKSPAVATVMPNINPSPAHLPPAAPGSYNYSNYPGGSGDNYPGGGGFNPASSEGGAFSSPAYYNNAPDSSGGNYWGQTPPYSNTSGYHTDTSSNFTDITESSMGSMASMNPPTAFGQNMNYNNSYGNSNEFNMQAGSSGAYSNYMGGTSGGSTFVATDASSSYNNTSGFNSTTNDSFNVNNSMYSSSSPFESNPSNQNTHSFNSNQFAESFNEGSSMYSPGNGSSSSFSSNQMPVSSANTNFSSNQIPMSSANTFNASNASASGFSANQMPSSASELDSTGGLVDLMLGEFPTPNPFDEARSSGEPPLSVQGGEAPSGEVETPAGGEGGKGEVTEEKEKGESGGEGEKVSTPVKTSGREEPGIPYDWAEKLMKDYVPGRVEEGNKMVVFMCILEQSLAAGDRILVFSQSLTTLTLIEQFLMKRFVPGRQERWARNKNYFRLDGSTISTDREKLINEFNSNDQVAMFLVSTRAGSLGINLVGANRVIVFDASWNPCHDTQAVCRVYRYGQQKPCFVYRLVMDSCLEKKIYDRQINKQGMADRVVDECNPDAHLSIKEVTNLCWDNEPVPEEKDFSPIKDKYRDSIIQLILDLHSFKLSKEPFQHESLLVDRKDKKLSSAEKRLAKRSYEMEKQAQTKPVYGGFKNNLGKPMASVRPMQSLGGLNMLREGIGAPRNRQWIPAEVWQKQGMSAQEMKLPLDVIIPTNSNERSIVLKKDQKVMVLKSPKGIYMQLENGKIIAIRTSNNKGGLGGLGGLGAMTGGPSPRPTMRMNSTRVIDSRLARDVSMTGGTRLHSPRGARPMISRGPRAMHRGAPALPGPPRFKNVSITPARPHLVKRNAPTHSVSCGTTTSPPASPVSSPSEPPKSLPSPSSENSKDKTESSPAPEPPTMDLSQPSPGRLPAEAPDSAAQDLSQSSLRGDSSSQDSQRGSSLRGDGPISSSLRDGQMSSSLNEDVHLSMSSSLLGDGQISSSLMGDSQMSSSLIESQMSSSLRGESQISSTRGGNQMSSSLQDQSMGRSPLGDTSLRGSSALPTKSQSMGSSRGESQISSSLRGASQTSSSLHGESQITSSLLGKSQSLNSSLRGESQITSSLRGDSQSLGHSSHLMGNASMLGKSQMSGSLLSDGQSLGSSLLGDATSLMGGTLKNEPYSRSMHSLIKNESLRPSDDLSLMNFDPAPNASMDYGYDYPAYGTAGGSSDFYSAPSYQHAPASAPIYTNTAAEGSSSYPYDMYSPFPSSAPGNAPFTPVSYGAPSSAFHRPDAYQQHPSPYPPQYPSEFYPPPP